MKYDFNFIWDVTVPLWPSRMVSVEAKATLVAIGLQESRFEARRQYESGPARGFWQFEKGGGIHGVLNHASTRSLIQSILTRFGYDFFAQTSWEAVEHNDILALSFARCLLWTVAGPLPQRGQAEYAWTYYLSGWRPGNPHRVTWNAYYQQAWQFVLT